jgi:hypothetical protein
MGRSLEGVEFGQDVDFVPREHEKARYLRSEMMILFFFVTLSGFRNFSYQAPISTPFQYISLTFICLFRRGSAFGLYLLLLVTKIFVIACV